MNAAYLREIMSVRPNKARLRRMERSTRTHWKRSTQAYTRKVIRWAYGVQQILTLD